MKKFFLFLLILGLAIFGRLWFVGDKVNQQMDNGTISATDLNTMANNGNAEAQTILGNNYSQGKDGLMQDSTQAAQWWNKAAIQGEKQSQFNLGVSYSRGVGVQKNNSMAYMWFSLAAAQNYPKARECIEYIKRAMTQQEIAEGERFLQEMQTKVTKN